MSTTTTTIAPLPAASLKGLVKRADTLKSHEDAGRMSVDDAKRKAFDTTVADHHDLGTYLTASVVPHLRGVAKVTADAIHDGFRSESSGIFVPAEKRDGLPSKSVMSRALDLVRLVPDAKSLPDVIETYLAVGNGYGFSGTFVPWLKLRAGESLGNKSKIDVKSTGVAYVAREGDEIVVFAAPGKGRTKVPGAIKRPAITPSGPATETRTLWDTLAARSDEELAKTVGDWDFGDLSTEHLESMARRAIAAYLIRTRAAKSDATPDVDMSILS